MFQALPGTVLAFPPVDHQADRGDIMHRNQTNQRSRLRRHRLAAAAVLSFTALLLVGCEIEKPAMPSFSTRFAVPLGTHEVTVSDIIEDQEYLYAGADSVLAFSLEGDTTSLSLDVDLSVDLDGESIDTELGPIELPASDPLDFGFTLLEIYPAAGMLPPGPVPVPPFDIDLDGDPADLPDITSAHVAEGGLLLTVTNNLPIPVSGDGPPSQLALQILDPADGSLLATAAFAGAIAPGETAEARADLAGVTLPDLVSIRLVGGSEGGFAADGLSPDDGLDVALVMENIVVDEATALIGAQSFTEFGEAPLPDDLGVLSALLESGSLDIDLTSGLPLDCAVTLTFPAMTLADGSPLAVPLTLPADGATATSVDLAGAVIASPDGLPLTALDWTLDISSDGSGDVPVTIAAGDRITATLRPATLALARVTGTVPEEVFVIDPVTETIDLPDELDGLHLQAAALTIEILNDTGIGGELNLELAGVSTAGVVTTVSAIARIGADEGKATRTVIVLDQDNSNIAELLSELPESFVFQGEVSIGGPGEVGTVRPGDGASVSWRIDAPLQLVIDQAEIDHEPTALDLDADARENIDDHLVAAELHAEIANHFPFGVEVRFLVGESEATTLSAPSLEIGPLDVTGGDVGDDHRWVVSPGRSTHVIPLSREQIGAFTRPDAHTAVVAVIPGTDGEEVVVRIGDHLSLTGALSIEVFVEDD